MTVFGYRLYFTRAPRFERSKITFSRFYRGFRVQILWVEVEVLQNLGFGKRAF